jgi:hypothetical protein
MKLGVLRSFRWIQRRILKSAFDFHATSVNAQFSVLFRAIVLIIARGVRVAASSPKEFENSIVRAVVSDCALLRALERRGQCPRIPCWGEVR